MRKEKGSGSGAWLPFAVPGARGRADEIAGDDVCLCQHMAKSLDCLGMALLTQPERDVSTRRQRVKQRQRTSVAKLIDSTQ